ncbi:hypothetical protein ACHAQJ_005612 [Trichoderma viride]
MFLESLPVEVCTMIIQEVANSDDPKSLSYISRTSKYLNSIANPILYKWNIWHDNSSAFWWAVKKNKADTFRRLVKSGASVNQLFDGKPPLMIAIEYNSVDIVRCLLTLPGVDWNWTEPDGTTALQYAFRMHGIEIVELLLSCENVLVDVKCNKGCTALMLAAIKKQFPSLVELLLARGADPDVRNNRGESPLWYAVNYGNDRVLRMLIDTGKVNVNLLPTATKSLPPLISAVYYRRLEVFKILLSHPDIDVNIASKNDTRRDQTAISVAAEFRNMDMVRMLLENPNTDPDKREKSGKTALKYAAKNQDRGIVSMLLADARVGTESRDWVKKWYGVTE